MKTEFRRVLLLIVVVMSREAESWSSAIFANTENSTLVLRTIPMNPGAMKDKRSVPDAILDPYSVLGFMSFATFLLSILYNRYKKKPHQNSMGATGGGKGNPPKSVPGIADEDSQQNMAHILNMASKILSNAAIRNEAISSNSSAFDSDYDYDLDDSSYLRSKNTGKKTQ